MTRALLALSLFAACGTAPRPTGVTIVLEGAARDVRGALADPIDPAVRLRVTDVPAPRPIDRDTELESALARARTAYVETLDMPGCIEALSPPSLVIDALARGDRDGAARALTYLCACHLAAGDIAAAERTAERLGVLGLAVPDADAISPRAESVLANAAARAAEAARAPIAVGTIPAAARILVDGRDAGCTTPCAIELAPGAHVLAFSLDGHDDTHVVARAPGDAVEVELRPASPERAARQWRERHSGAPDSWGSLRLLMTAVRDRRVALLTGIPSGDTYLLRASLAIGSERPLRVERSAARATLDESARAALRDLLTRAGVIPPRPIHEEPLFWIAIAAAAGLAAGITAGLSWEPEIRTPVSVIGRDE
jgi:hypothetical protein